MKKEESRLTLGGKRTIFLLTNAFLTLLEEKSFEEIHIKELCERSMVPRATFYAYFEDKYDLLNYAFIQMEHQIYPELEENKKDVPVADVEKAIFDMGDTYYEDLKKVLHHNPEGGELLVLFERFFTDAVYRAIIHSKEYHDYNLPVELIAEVNTAAIFAVFEWVYIKGYSLTRQEIRNYLYQLYVA